MPLSDRDTLLRIGWRLDALDDWRDNIDHKLASLEDRVDELVEADKIADAVAKKMSSTQALHLSKIQRRWGVAGIVFTAIGALSGVAALILTATGTIG